MTILKIIRSRVSSHGHSQMVVTGLNLRTDVMHLDPGRPGPRSVFACNDLFLIYKAPPLILRSSVPRFHSSK